MIEDPRYWGDVAAHFRGTLGADMEAYVVGRRANKRGSRLDFLIMKGVMDFANHGRDDQFKEFAARASAECLIAFLREHLEPKSEEP